MNVCLVNELGEDVTATGTGQPACRGLVNSLGYYNNEDAQRKRYTDAGSSLW